MSELLRRACEMKSVIGQNHLPRHEQLKRALHSLSGLNITAIEKDTWAPLERSLVEVNAIIDLYAMTSEDDYARMSAADSQAALKILADASQAAIEVELDRIIAELDKGFDKLPVEAILEAREHRELIVPRLIGAIRDAAARARSGEKLEGNAHFFALFLLSEFDAVEALPAIVEAISLPGELPGELFGDVLTESMANFLAQFAGDNLELLDGLIANRELNRFVRWEAAQAFVLLVRDGRMTLTAAASRLRNHLRQAIDAEDVDLIEGLIHELLVVGVSAASDEIFAAFDRGLVDTYMISRGDVDRALAAGDEGVRRELANLPPTKVVDTIAELRTWAAFSEKPAKPPAPVPWPPPAPPAPAPRIPKPHAFETVAPTAAPVISHHGHTGRNDPCPCGSGKKFKKCCSRLA